MRLIICISAEGNNNRLQFIQKDNDMEQYSALLLLWHKDF